MSFKYQAQKVGDAKYVLEKCGDMKVDADIFLSEELYDSSEEEMWGQLYNLACYEGVVGAYVLPDCHTGYNFPIGVVIVTEDTLIQSGSGFDISCGCLYIKANLTANSVKSWDKRRRWVDEVEKRVSTGAGHHRPKLMPSFSLNQAQEFIRYGAKALGVSSDLCERQYIEVPKDTDLSKIKRATDKLVGQLGSIGSGNHFCELQVDQTSGEVYTMVHCGSRGYGYQVANHFFYEGAELRGIPKNQRERSWLKAEENLGKEYWAYHNSAANYAIVNRHIIAQGVQEAFKEVFGCESEVLYEISHNLIQEETLVLPDGSTKRGFVHRKGSTRAFPANHPDLIGTKFESTGHPVLIPGSMYDGAAILYPEQGAYKSGCSVNHGSGRILARGKAKKKLEHKQQYINDEMKTIKRTFNGVPIEGIVSNCRNIPLDESRYVYKNLDNVLQVLEANGIAKVTNRLYPIANIKGAD